MLLFFPQLGLQCLFQHQQITYSNIFRSKHKLCRLCFFVLLLLLLCMEADFSESKSSKTNWKHLILHQEHKDFSIGIKNKSWLAVASSKRHSPSEGLPLPSGVPQGTVREQFCRRAPALWWSNHLSSAMR